MADADAARRRLVALAKGEAHYWNAYVLPWMGRRLTGRSSGDGRSPKFADWVLVPPGR